MLLYELSSETQTSLGRIWPLRTRWKPAASDSSEASSAGKGQPGMMFLQYNSVGTLEARGWVGGCMSATRGVTRTMSGISMSLEGLHLSLL